MKEFTVSLDIVSPSLTLAEISAKLGRSHSEDSHNKGDVRAMGRRFAKTIWRLGSKAQPNATMTEHLTNIVSQLSPTEFRRTVRPDDPVTVCVNVGVMSEGMASVTFTTDTVDIIRAYGASLEISYYPCTS